MSVHYQNNKILNIMFSNRITENSYTYTIIMINTQFVFVPSLVDFFVTGKFPLGQLCFKFKMECLYNNLLSNEPVMPL